MVIALHPNLLCRPIGPSRESTLLSNFLPRADTAPNNTADSTFAYITRELHRTRDWPSFAWIKIRDLLSVS